MKARVYVRLKTEVSDPEGRAIGDALATLHYDAVRSVRVGKVFDLELEENDPKRAAEAIAAIANDVLANPTIEEFTFEIEGASGNAPESESATR